MNTVRPNGRLEQTARMELDSSGPELVSKEAVLHTYHKDKVDILQSIKKLTGHTPRFEEEDGDADMS